MFYLLRVINPTARITMAINIAIPMMMTIKIPCGKDMAFSMKSVSPHALAEIKNPSKLVYIERFFLEFLKFGNLLLENVMNRTLPSEQFNLFPSHSPSLHLKSTVSCVAWHLRSNLSFALSASTPVVFGQSGQPFTRI